MSNSPFVRISNGNFNLGQEVFRFIGCNMYELANVESGIAESMLTDAADEGFKVVRFWAFEPTDKSKFRLITEVSRDLELKLIPVLADTWGFLQNYKIYGKWYKDGYRKNYLPYVKDIVTDFRNCPEILIWELINEPSTDSFPDIYNFARDVSLILKNLSPENLFSIGTVGGIGDKFGNFFSRFNHKYFEELYSIDTLDALSLHDYSFNSTLFERLDILYRLKGNYRLSRIFGETDKLINYMPETIDKITLNKLNKTYDFPLTFRRIWRYYNSRNVFSARLLKKPVYVGETGIKKSMNKFRPVILENEIRRYFSEGIAGVLLWSFEARGKSLDGHDYGFDKNDLLGDTVKKIQADFNSNREC